MSARRYPIFFALIALALLAACGSSGSGSSTTGTIDRNIQSGVKEALGASTSTTAAAPTSMEAWEALWAKERSAIVNRIKSNGWGKTADGKKVVGPEGYTIDLTKCPAGWQDTEGLTDKSIKVGFTGPLSGTLADVGNNMRLLDAMFKYENAHGGFTDSTGKTRQAQLVMRDDGYDPSRTIPLVDELLDSEKVFAIGTIGTPNQVKVFGKINQRCVPHPAISGHSSVGDPVGHPWTTSSSISYTSEAILLGQFVEERLDTEFGGKAKVAVLYFSNDFGTAFDAGFRSFISSSKRGGDFQYITQVIEPNASTITDAMTTIAAQKPDVFIAAVAGTACTQAVNESAQNGMKEQVKYKFLDSSCKASGVKPLTLGAAMDNWYADGGGYRDLFAPASDTDPWMLWARQMLKDAGIDYKSSTSFNSALFYMWPWIQAFKIADDLPGGLTRTNFNLAFRAMDMTHPHLYPGIKFNMNGNKDAFFVEGSDITRWDGAKQAWVVENVIDVSGRTKPCLWDENANKCG